MNDTVHLPVHRSVHLCGERKLLGAQRLRIARRLILDAGKTPGWAGVAVAVEKYATFIQCTPDHVVNSALKIVIWRDVEFRRWRKQQQTQADRKDVHAAPKAARA